MVLSVLLKTWFTTVLIFASVVAIFSPYPLLEDDEEELDEVLLELKDDELLELELEELEDDDELLLEDDESELELDEDELDDDDEELLLLNELLLFDEEDDEEDVQSGSSGLAVQVVEFSPHGFQ